MERATVGWVHRYNHERLHSSLGHIPPIEHYTNYQRENYAGLHAALKNSGRFRAKAFDAYEAGATDAGVRLRHGPHR
ncbi:MULTISPECIES: integrase core domain-containing protein [Dermabacter]|uniref:integrase core domain-containing protein n=1 Tax=Dermabacter TaxID=36739 RepID=UPI001D04F0A9|nr:integrase core domain-containing protein [Dermabacter jinjuensis]